ncbi:MAG: peptidoglycan DD-metalloendopeptidase family protein [Proteobacteria bacterium]|nr:peptidoglycan DD-metalloendopeptidase family protein [Pseudomonadota bacterium]
MKRQTLFIIAFSCILGTNLFYESEASGQSLIWPAQGCTYITSPYGNRGSSFHSGTDISCGGTINILAAADGTVVNRTYSTGQCSYVPAKGTCPVCDNHNGNSVRIDHGGGLQTNYLHMKTVYVSKGDKVKCGQVIGIMGTTGCSTGQHLHFMVYPNYPNHANPMNYVTKGNYTCPVTCTPTTEVCDGKDNDCDGAVDEDEVCAHDYEVIYQSMNYDPQNTDIDGDGKADICARGAAGIYCSLSGVDMASKAVMLGLSNEQGWDDVSNYATIRFADINGDSLADICARANVGLGCWLSTGTEFVSTGGVPMSDEDGYNHVKYYSTIKFADINGDGKEDFCARFKDSFKCFPAQEGGFAQEGIALGDMGDEQGWGEEKYYSTIRMADINGDGRVDVCGRGGGGFWCWPSNGDSFGNRIDGPAWSNDNGWGNRQYYTTIRLPDINGDHKADLCARDSAGIVCHLSNGEGWGDAIRGPEWSDAWGWNDYDNYSTVMFGDINGDGMDDVCARANAKFVCVLSTGEGFGDSFEIDRFSDENGWNNPNKFRTLRLGDVNGDGKMDVCSRTADNAVCYVFNGSGFDEVSGAEFSDGTGWGAQQYYSTFRVGGPRQKPCSFLEEVCDEADNNCNGEIDENNVCCVPSEEVCDRVDNDCDGEVDEDDVCCVEEVCDGADNDCDGEVDEDNVCCEPSEEICDNKDNDCDGAVDEDDVCCGEEVCDGEDNDCDGEVDEDNVCCEPSEEVCDDKDNNCDGRIDEDGVCDKADDETDEDDKNDENDEECEKDESGECMDAEPITSEVVSADDCACSTSRSSAPSLPLGSTFGIMGLLGMLVVRRRKDRRAGSR